MMFSLGGSIVFISVIAFLVLALLSVVIRVYFREKRRHLAEMMQLREQLQKEEDPTDWKHLN